MHVIYTVRPGDENDELRYSLRSVAANLEHSGVTIVGHAPAWVQNVTVIPTKQDGEKYENTAFNWYKAVLDHTGSDEFIAFNDDFYVMQPVEKVEYYHKGDLAAAIDKQQAKPGPYLYTMQRTQDALHKLGFFGNYHYGVHIPMVMRKSQYRAMIAALDSLGYELKDVQARTMYGNMYRVGGQAIEDVKSSNRGSDIASNDTFLSSNDQAFYEGKIGQLLRDSFKNKCKYER